MRQAESAADQRGRAAAGILQDLRAALTADEFATRLAPALARTDDAIFEWLASGQPKPVDEPPATLRPDDVHLRLPASPPSMGQATRAQGAPASDVLEPLREFLEANPEKRVVVEWRVQE